MEGIPVLEVNTIFVREPPRRCPALVKASAVV
jgi:hypothetical protein